MLDIVAPLVPTDTEAVIEEARQRARRRRRRIAASVIGLLVLGALVAAILIRADGGERASTGVGPRPTMAGRAPDLLFMRTLSNDHLLRVDLRRGHARFLPIALACGDTPFCLIGSGDQLVISDVGRTLAYSPAATGRPRPVPVGNGWITVPDQDPGAVWLGILGRDSSAHDPRLTAVREVDLHGRVLRSMHPPNGQWPVEAVDDGLLFQYPHHLRLWSFATHAFTARLPGAFPADVAGNSVASCDDRCRAYVVTDLRTGSALRVMPPVGYRWTSGYDGEFSPDGRLLALPIRRTATTPGDADALALVNLSADTARVIPGSDAVDPIYRAMTWSTEGDRLFFATTSGAVLAYTPGTTSSATVAKLPQRAQVMQMVAVSRSG